MIPYLLLFLMVLIYFLSFWKIFEKNGRKKWEGLVPVYNIYVWLKIINKPWWWLFFFPIPFVNLIVAIGCNVETARLFGKYTVKDSLLMILFPWYYIPYLAFDKSNTVVKPTDWTNNKDREERKWHDQITLFFIAPIVGHALYIVSRLFGSKDKPNKKTMAADWTNALGFAIVAASIIRSLFFEAFTIPTGSMEKTMRIGDYLFVNKIKYGAKLPQTPISIPFVHNRIPLTFIPSYVDWFSSDYRRLLGYGEIKRGDIMVFNWPVGDSVIVHEGVIAHDYYAILRNQAFINCVRDLKAFDNNGINLSAERYEKLESKYLNAARKKLISGGGLTQSPVGPIDKTGGIATLPIDKKENYIKRCVAVGGDTLEIVNNLLLINGKAEKQKDEVIFNYNFYFKPGSYIPQDKILEDFEIYNDQHTRFNIENKYVSEIDTSFKDSMVYTKKLVAFSKEQITCSPKTAKMLTRYSGLDSMGQDIHPRGFDYSIYGQYYPYFPNHPDFNWSRDNYGPLIVPKKGWSVSLNDSTWTLYKRVIEVYEGNDIEISVAGDFLINNKIENQYTFKQNYYWLMGDNRHGSADSRCWGFVPEDHVVGTASFVWFSKHPETGIRWSRIFSTVH
ncbi:MAG: S26 family signal peptidase [Flavobacteriales bacterium]|jgi:signal peptidase I|nr:S26 family signal peptidase [Flavobacteriales bacterium]MDG1440745.1 S26 family signal peptidase [Flavobacteriales bacterium]